MFELDKFFSRDNSDYIAGKAVTAVKKVSNILPFPRVLKMNPLTE